MLTIRQNKLTAQQFTDLRNSVWDGAPTYEQTKLALENSASRRMKLSV